MVVKIVKEYAIALVISLLAVGVVYTGVPTLAKALAMIVATVAWLITVYKKEQAIAESQVMQNDQLFN